MIRKTLLRLLLALACLAPALPAAAQIGPGTNGPFYGPNWPKGYVPTPAQWQLLWTNKVDYFPGGIPIQYGGCGATTAAQCLANLGGLNTVLTSGYIYVGSAANVATPRQPSGDVTLTNVGAFSVVNGSHITNSSIPNSGLVNTATTVNGQTCTLGSTCTVTAVASSVAPGTTAVSPNTNPKGLFYNNAGVLGVLASANSSVWVTDGSGNTSASTTLPSGLAMGTPASINLSNGTALPWGSITNTPTTLAGYGITSPLPVAEGGTNCAAASGTCLDNVTGFSSTGYLRRTGAGTYSFVTDPSDVISVFGRTGAVVAATNDYNFNQLAGSWTLAQGPTLSANVVLGQIVSGVPAALAMTDCHGSTDAVTWQAGVGFNCHAISAGTGTVTSVALTVPSILSVSGSPITTSGTLAVTLATQSATLVFAGPTSGGAAAPTFRTLAVGDLPTTGYVLGTSTATTQSAGDASTKLATTAYVDAVPRLQTKVITFTKNLADADTSTAYTGCGFQPTAITLYAGNGTVNAAWNSSDSARTIAGLYDAAAPQGTNSFVLGSGVNYQSGLLSSYDSDGFTIAWTKTNAPGGTLNVKVRCEK